MSAATGPPSTVCNVTGMEDAEVSRAVWVHDQAEPYERREGRTGVVLGDWVTVVLDDPAALIAGPPEIEGYGRVWLGNLVHRMNETSVYGCAYCYGASRRGGPAYPDRPVTAI
jgi:hypothetical protein